MYLQYLGETELYSVIVNAVKSNVIEVIGDFPHQSTGFNIIIKNGVVVDHSQFQTIYRDFDDRCQFSNDGSVWVQPVKDIVISATFDNELHEPDTVDVKLMEFYGDVEVATITLRKENNYIHTLYNVPAENNYRLEATYVENYSYQVDGMTVRYTIIYPTEDVIEEIQNDITDTQVGLAETYEQVETNTNDILDCQLALAEIYEMIIGGNSNG